MFTERMMMEEARKAFEALMASKGKRIPFWDGSRYATNNVQGYWRWFLMGWNLRELSK